MAKCGQRLLVASAILSAIGFLGCHDSAETASSVEDSFDFGEVEEGTLLEHVFFLENVSDSAIEIESRQTTCSCTLLKDIPSHVQPHGRIEVPVALRTNSKSGRISEAALFTLSDGSLRRFELRAIVCGRLIAKLDLGPFLRGTRESREVDVSWCGDVPVSFEHLMYDKKYFDVSVFETREVDKMTRLHIEIARDLPYGLFLENVAVTNANARFPERIIQVQGVVRELVEAEPAIVTLGTVKPEEDITGEVKIFSPYQHDVKILAVTDETRQEISCTTKDAAPHVINFEFTFSTSPEASSIVVKKVLSVACFVDGEEVTVTIEVYGFI